MNSQIFKNLILWLVIFVAIIALYQFINTPKKEYVELNYSEFLSYVKSDQVKNVEFNENKISHR